MRVVPGILLLLLHSQICWAWSADLCPKISSVSDALGWLCNVVHGTVAEEPLENEIESSNLEKFLRPITKASLIQKAIQSYSRQQKIVGGKPVDQGESPWTVR